MTMKIWTCTVALATGITCAAMAQSTTDRPWQHADGTIEFGDRTYQSWQEYHRNELFKNGIFHKCGTPHSGPNPQGGGAGFMGGGPSDCSMSSTNPSDIYDPAVVTYRVPVVVHVIRNANGSQGDISIAKVESGIRILNEDINAIAGTNGALGNDARMEFYLADTDPQGNATNGITFSNNDTWFNDGGNYWNSLAWDPARYMNVYTNTASGNLGYVPFLPQEGNPGGAEDRVVVLWSTYGEDGPYGPPFDQGRTLTHEVGHYLGLFHVFDGCGGSCSSSGDRVCDTNPQSSPTFGCSSADTCGSTDNIQNYMDYSDDLCMTNFSPQQNRRMRCTLEHYRPQLFSTDGGGGGNPCDTGCTGDIDGSGNINGADLGLLIASWGPCGETECCADIDQSGEVDGGDLGTMLGSWGDCTPVDPCEGVNCDDGDPCTQDSCVDGSCVNTPIDGCGKTEGCGDPNAGSCSTANGTPYCDDEACCTTVCANDSYCCENEWDTICAQSSATLCSDGGGDDGCGAADAGSCGSPNGSPYCNDEGCCDAVCTDDPFCCNTEWDQVCADAAASTTVCNS